MKTFETAEFKYNPSIHVPFRDKKVLGKMREISRDDFLNHPNPDLNIKVMDDSEVGFFFMMDIFFRIKEAMENGEKLVMILPQPWPLYKNIAYMINKSQINCKNLYTFNMDEYANQDGNIAPESWPYGFTHSLKKYFYSELDPQLRPPESQMVGLSNENFRDYGKMITDLGGADICYSGPGWTGHMAFVDPDAPEVPKDLEEFKKMGPAIVTLSPFTLAQNSLHGSFGASGDLAAVPPKAATIGPAQFLEAKHNLGFYSIGIHGTSTSWQRLIARLALFGPITPLVPDSLIQLKKADVIVSENIAAKIEIDWDKGY
jgi:6-phosphogluconolactonase/glucosamine-6-phosphate isomerase/deaminase